MNEPEKFDPQPVPFRMANYDYKLRIGEVTDTETVSWEQTVYVPTWDDLQEIVEMARATREYPAFKVELKWRGEDHV